MMYCVDEQRNLRKGSSSTCWGNVCLFKGVEARSCGYVGNVFLCKKHHAEKIRENKKNCCFPLISSGGQCAGNIVPCPQRLFPVLDSCQVTCSKPGTFICTKHLKYADENQEICSKEDYAPPQKVTGQFTLLQLFSFVFFVWKCDPVNKAIIFVRIALIPAQRKGYNCRLWGTCQKN